MFLKGINHNDKIDMGCIQYEYFTDVYKYILLNYYKINIFDNKVEINMHFLNTPEHNLYLYNYVANKINKFIGFDNTYLVRVPVITIDRTNFFTLGDTDEIEKLRPRFIILDSMFIFKNNSKVIEDILKNNQID